MTKTRSAFWSMPRTAPGRWAVGLAALFTLLFLAITNGLFSFPGMLTMLIGVAAGILDLAAIIWKRERSWLNWLMLLPGLFAILFAAGEVIFPH